MKGHTLRWLVSRIDQSRPYYLLGEVEIPDGKGPALAGRLDSVESYNPASYRGKDSRLHDARTQELEPWLDLVAVRGEVVCKSAQAGRGGGDAGAEGGTGGGKNSGAGEAVSGRELMGGSAFRSARPIPDDSVAPDGDSLLCPSIHIEIQSP